MTTPVLEYQTPAARSPDAVSFGPPMSWSCVVALIVLWTFPALLTLWSVDALYMRPATQMIGWAALSLPVFALFVVHSRFVTHEPTTSTADTRHLARRRLLVVMLASGGIYGLHAAAVPLRLAFLCHLPAFERARAAALAAPPAGGVAPHQRIGLFDIRTVAVAADGSVAFRLEGGSGFQTGPTILLFPPANGGSLGGGWRWEATD